MNPDEIAAAVLGGVQKLIAKAVEPLQARIAELEGRAAPSAEDVAAEVARTLLGGDGIKSLIDLQLTEYMAENPPEKGEKGDPGEKGLDGKDGADGVGLAGALIDRAGELVVTLTNGTQKSLGPVIGKDGADGLGFDDMDVIHDGEGAVTFKFGRAGVVKEFPVHFPVPTFKGYWRDGRKAQPGHVYTHKGNAWIAIKETDEQPTREAKDCWQILAAKGNDGRDGKDLMPRPQTIKLGSSNA
jgi:integrin beta 3